MIDVCSETKANLRDLIAAAGLVTLNTLIGKSHLNYGPLLWGYDLNRLIKHHKGTTVRVF